MAKVADQPDQLDDEQPDSEADIVTVAVSPVAWARVTVLIGVAISVLLFLMVLLAGTGSQFFQRKVTLRTFLPDATGIDKKDMVEIDGIPVGRVRSVSLSGSNEPSRVVAVELNINRKYLDSIPVDSRVEVTADNLLGDKYINIRKGIGHEYVKPGDELLVQPANVNFNPADLIASVQSALKQASGILDQIDDPESNLGALVQGEAVYDQLRDEIIAAQKKIYSFRAPKSPVGQALFGTKLYDDLRNPIIDLDKRLASIQAGEGDIGRVFATSEQYDQVRQQIVDFHNSTVELRKNRYLTSDEDYRNLQAAVKNLKGTVESLLDAPLLTNAQLYEELNGQSRSAANFLSDFRKNPRKYLRMKIF